LRTLIKFLVESEQAYVGLGFRKWGNLVHYNNTILDKKITQKIK